MTDIMPRDEVPSIGLDDDRIKFLADRLLEIARIRSAAERGDGPGDKEDLASYAGEVVALRRSLLAAHDEIDRLRADAQAAVALVASKAYALGFEASGEGWNGEYPTSDFRNDPRWVARSARELAALAPTDGLALVAELRAEVDRLQTDVRTYQDIVRDMTARAEALTGALWP